MKTYHDGTDITTLIGQRFSIDYLHQVQAARLLAADDFEGYDEWSAQLESVAWAGAEEFNGVLIKKACEHTTCGHFECDRRDLRSGGFDL